MALIMRDGAVQSILELDWESEVVHKAIRFANSKTHDAVADQKWMVGQYRKLKVLPPRTPYFIDDRGRIQPRRRNQVAKRENIWAAASIRTLENIWIKLIDIMDEVIRDSLEPPDQVIRRVRRATTRTEDSKTRIVLDFPIEGWARTFIDGTSIRLTTKEFISPTMDVFTQYAAVLLSSEPWRTRLYRCVECGRYFLNPLRKRGRRRHVCSDRCNAKRGDQTAWKRSRDYRDRKRNER